VLANADELSGDYVATPIEIPDDIAVRVIPISDLPPGWNASPPIGATRQIGTNRAWGLATAVLSVPSAIIPQERNFILNPAHPDFECIRPLARSRFISMIGSVARDKVLGAYSHGTRSPSSGGKRPIAPDRIFDNRELAPFPVAAPPVTGAGWPNSAESVAEFGAERPGWTKGPV